MAASSSLLQRLWYLTEATALTAVFGAASILPSNWATAFGAGLGRFAGNLDGRRRRVAIANLLEAYGDELTEAEARKIAIEYYANLGRNFFEMQVMARRHPEVPFSHYIEVEDEQIAAVKELIREHGSLVFVTCHGGMWELMGSMVVDRITRLHIVFRPMPNPWLDRRLSQHRARLGVDLIQFDQRALAQMQRLLRKGENVAIVGDLNQKQGGVFADFFGRPASTGRAPALLSVRRETPVVCGYTYRTETPYRYVSYFDPPIYPPREGTVDEKVLAITQEINRSIERFVRAHPAQWQWNYKRWKTQPDDRSTR